jgi:hypothetical protein
MKARLFGLQALVAQVKERRLFLIIYFLNQHRERMVDGVGRGGIAVGAPRRRGVAWSRRKPARISCPTVRFWQQGGLAPQTDDRLAHRQRRGAPTPSHYSFPLRPWLSMFNMRPQPVFSLITTGPQSAWSWR